MTMHGWLDDPIVVKGAVQVAAALVPALVVVALSRLRSLELETEMGVALVRGLLQILAVGSVLGLLLTVDLAWSGLILAAMMLTAAAISHRRAGEMPDAFWVSLAAITLGTGSVIVAMTWAGAIETTVRNLVPVGSMIVYAGLKTNSLALDRLDGELDAQRERIETRISLGASGVEALVPEVRASVKAALIPVVDSLKSLGVVWIPGMMAGMVLSGSNPIYAAEYQFVIMGMVFGASGLTGVIATALMSRRLVTDAHQLRPRAA